MILKIYILFTLRLLYLRHNFHRAFTTTHTNIPICQPYTGETVAKNSLLFVFHSEHNYKYRTVGWQMSFTYILRFSTKSSQTLHLPLSHDTIFLAAPLSPLHVKSHWQTGLKNKAYDAHSLFDRSTLAELQHL